MFFKQKVISNRSLEIQREMKCNKRIRSREIYMGSDGATPPIRPCLDIIYIIEINRNHNIEVKRRLKDSKVFQGHFIVSKEGKMIY